MLTPFALIHDDLKLVESEIIANIRSDVNLIPEIGRHIFLSGGKRFRPALVILCFHLFKSNDPRCTSLAGAVELIHTATLLHDDVVDRAELRRGKRSVNSLWGNEASILVGDFLFSQAILLMIQAGDMKLLEILADATKKMSEGEIFGLSHSNSLRITEDQYMRIIFNKTAVLISAACRIGAVLGGADNDQYDRLNRFGENVGIAFQLMDDVLDYSASAEEIGKPIGGDFFEQKATLPLIHALRSISTDRREYLAAVFLKETKDDADFRFASDIIKESGGIQYTLDKAHGYIRSAKENINSFVDSEEKNALLQLADYVIMRNV